MRIVVADTGPIHYLALLGQSEILPALFEKVIIPSVVRDELDRAETPAAVRKWIQSPPAWLEFHGDLDNSFDDALGNLDEGERAVLTLATSLGADLLLMDDRPGVRMARIKGFRVIGTLRVLQLAAQRGLLNLPYAFEQIKGTNFRYRQQLMDELLNDAGSSRARRT